MNAAAEDGTLTAEVARKLYMAAIEKEILEQYHFPQTCGKDGYYRIYVRDMTKKSGRKQLSARTLPELKQKVLDWEKGTVTKAKRTFRDAFEMAMEDKLSHCTNPQKRLSVQNTIGRTRSEYRRFFGDTAFEQMLVDEITKRNVEDIILSNLKKYSLRQKGFASLHSVLRVTFSFAYHEEWIEKNVYDRIDFGRYRDMLADDVAISDRTHSEEDIGKMLSYLHQRQEKRPSYVPAYALEFQILTGFRRGEIPPLRWSDIRDGLIYVHREQVTVKAFAGKAEHDEIVDHTKTRKNRYFPVSSELQELLDRLQGMHDRFYPQSEYLFPADSRLGCITNNTVYQFYRRMCGKLGVAVSRAFTKGTHAFRRTRITEVANKSRGDLLMTAGLFGNSPAVIMKNYYSGIDLESAREVLEKSSVKAG